MLYAHLFTKVLRMLQVGFDLPDFPLTPPHHLIGDFLERLELENGGGHRPQAPRPAFRIVGPPCSQLHKPETPGGASQSS